MYRAIRAFTEPEGFKYSSLAYTPSICSNGVEPIASMIEVTYPAVGSASGSGIVKA